MAPLVPIQIANPLPLQVDPVNQPNPLELAADAIVSEIRQKAPSDVILQHIRAVDNPFHLLQALVKKMCDDQEALQLFDQLVKSLPLETVKELLRNNNVRHDAGLLQELQEKGRVFLQYAEANQPQGFKERLQSIVKTLRLMLESLIEGFGVADIFTPSENQYEAESKWRKVFTLSSSAAIFTPVLGASGAAVFIFAVALLSLIYPYINPRPPVLPYCENLTQKMREGQLYVTGGRKEVSDAIAHALQLNAQVKQHPLLLGRSGVGKTEAVRAFAKAVADGEYPALVGKEVFYLNTAELVSNPSMWGESVLKKIREKLGNNRDNVIIIFDEIHKACQKIGNNSLGDQLKPLLDPNSEGFPYFIGITTQEEYERDILQNNSAFQRRFKAITVDNMEAITAVEVLSRNLLEHAPAVLVAPNVLESLVNKVKHIFGENIPQPYTSLTILAKALQYTERVQRSESEKKINALQAQIASIRAQNAVEASQGANYEERQRRVVQLTTELQQHEAVLAAEKIELARIEKAKKEFVNIKKDLFLHAIALPQNLEAPLSSASELHMKHALLAHALFLPCAIERLRTIAARAGIAPQIDEALIDRVIQEERGVRQQEVQVVAPVARARRVASQPRPEQPWRRRLRRRG